MGIRASLCYEPHYVHDPGDSASPLTTILVVDSIVTIIESWRLYCDSIIESRRLYCDSIVTIILSPVDSVESRIYVNSKGPDRVSWTPQ